MVAGLKRAHFGHGLCLERVCGGIWYKLHAKQLSGDPVPHQESVIDPVVGEVLHDLVLAHLSAKALRLVDERYAIYHLLLPEEEQISVVSCRIV